MGIRTWPARRRPIPVATALLATITAVLVVGTAFGQLLAIGEAPPT